MRQSVGTLQDRLVVLVQACLIVTVFQTPPAFTDRRHRRQVAAVLALAFRRQVQHVTADDAARLTVIGQTLLRAVHDPTFGFTSRSSSVHVGCTSVHFRKRQFEGRIGTCYTAQTAAITCGRLLASGSTMNTARASPSDGLDGRLERVPRILPDGEGH